MIITVCLPRTGRAYEVAVGTNYLSEARDGERLLPQMRELAMGPAV
jgi:hypothetical protein